MKQHHLIEVIAVSGKVFGKDSEEWLMFREYWQLCQKYYIPEDDENYWNSLVKSIGMFNLKYKNDFANELTIAFFNTVEKMYKQKCQNKRRT